MAEKLAKEKNAAAVALGRLGGLKGGRIRAKRLSEERRSEIASVAARARWRRQMAVNKKKGVDTA